MGLGLGLGLGCHLPLKKVLRVLDLTHVLLLLLHVTELHVIELLLVLRRKLGLRRLVHHLASLLLRLLLLKHLLLE